ncbi:MAG: alcohol dehydrogenase catalytic domain-containing protein [Bryobacteraceae bacterium]|nr:alcohol dehydrogenase catalytic domain-containing protein [Bryobacteraceae bacterium]
MRAAYYEGNKTITIGDCHTAAPQPGQVQIRVSHCGICGTDLHIFHGNMDHRVKMPQVIGHEMSGLISAVGPGVTGWSEGDRVTVRPLDYCGECPACRAGHSHICQKLKFIGIDSPGAMQGVWNVPAHTLHRLPNHLSLAQGAMIEPIAVACHDVRLGQVKPGEYVVVQGGGPIGALIALVCRNEGANVLVTELNPYRLKLLDQLGVRGVNPMEQDVVELVNQETGAAGADVVFEVTGAAAAAEMMTKLPRTRGRIVMVAIHAKPTSVDLFRFFWRELKLIGARVYEPEDFEKAIALAAAGALPFDRLITNTLPLEGLASGFHQLEGGGDVMKILIECGGAQ